MNHLNCVLATTSYLVDFNFKEKSLNFITPLQKRVSVAVLTVFAIISAIYISYRLLGIIFKAKKDQPKVKDDEEDLSRFRKELLASKELCEKLLKVDPNNVKTLVEYGKVLSKLHEKKDAQAIFLDALTYDIDNQEALIGYARTLLYFKDYATAQTSIEKVLKLNPDNSDAWACYALVFMSLNKSQKVEDYLKKSLELDPKNVFAWTIYGVYCTQIITHFHESLIKFEEALKIDPYDPIALSFYARYCQETNDVKENMYKKALEIDPFCPYALEDYGDLLLQKVMNNPTKEDAEAGEQIFQRILKHKSTAVIHTKCAICLFEAGRVDESENHFKKALKINPQSGFALTMYAKFLEKEGREEDKKVVDQQILTADHSDYIILKNS